MLHSRSDKLSRSRSRHINSLKVLITIVGFTELTKTVTCFNVCSVVSHSNLIHYSTRSRSKLAGTESINDDVSRQLAKAKELIAQSKVKLAAQQESEQPTEVVEEMSSELEDAEKRTKVTKSTDDESGLITTDGDLMAMLSEEEDWEMRDIFNVFEDELEESDVSKQLAQRDVAASLYGLRISMQNEDYSKIFNNRDYFIGEN